MSTVSMFLLFFSFEKQKKKIQLLMVKLLLQQEVVFLNINKKDPNKFFLLKGISRWGD